MSFGPKVFSGLQELLVLALMLVSVFAIFYVNMDVTYKIGMVVIVFAVIFLTTLATQILRQQAEAKKAAAA
jgi:preprotein translocase subunit YajC